MKKHNLSILVCITFIFTVFVGCRKDSTPANASWVGNYTGTVSADVNSGGSANVPDTLRVSASGTISNQIYMFDVLDSINYTGTVNGRSVAMTATLPAGQGYSAETLTGTGTLASGVFAVTIMGSYTYNSQTYHDTVSYNMVKH
jgi:hypothetical protein